MLKTRYFEFGRDGIITFFYKITYQQFKVILNMCREHAKLKHIKRPYDWDWPKIPTLTEAV
jgi:hypothetical protein